MNDRTLLTSSTADPDGDGQPNLIEYAFNTNPLLPDPSPFNITRMTDGSLRLNYPRRTGFSGLIYTVLKSDDLINWSPADEILSESVQPVPGQNLEIVTEQIVIVSQRAFFRIVVESIAP